MLFNCQECFDQSRDENTFSSWVRSLGIPQDTQTAFQAVRCATCKSIPTIVYSDPDNSNCLFAMRFICGRCETFWNVCRSCPINNQPQNFLRLSRRQVRQSNRLTITDIVKRLDDSLLEHSSCHTNQLSNDNEDDYIHDNDDDDNNVMIENVNTIVEHIISSMFSNNVQSSFNKLLKCAIMERETSKKYPDYLIKKYWLKNADCDLYPEEVLMFLRHVRFIMHQSRQGNIEVTRILSTLHSINSKKYNDVFDRYEEQTKLLEKSQQIIESLKATIASNGISVDVDILDQSNQTVTNSVLINHADDHSYIHLRLPVTQSDVRKLLETRHSFLSNILIPPIIFDAGGISWTKPSDVLRMALCFGVPIEVVNGRTYDVNSLHIRSIYRSPVIRKLISESDIDDDVMTVIFGYWSDGCYCGTESKGRRNQAKVATIHIAYHEVTERHVFPLLFGRKDDSDEDVKKNLFRDMDELAKTTVLCYIPSLRQVKKVRFLLAYAIQDRIEHAETTCFLGATGKCSRFVTMSCPIVTKVQERGAAYSLCKSLMSCWNCWNKRVDLLNRGMFHEAERSRRCSECYDWNLCSVEFYVPTIFPLDAVNVNELSTIHPNAIKSKKITFQTMKEACHTIFENVKSGTWNQSVADSYAKRECIRESVWKKVWRTAKDASRNPNVPIDQVVLDESSLPCFWNQSLLSLDGFQLGIMHYLFLNVGKHLLEIINMRLSELGLWSKVFEIWSQKLILIRKLCLSWCKAWSLGSSTTPGSVWVAENYVGFSIICKSLSSVIYTCEEAFEHIPMLQDVLESYYTLCAVVMRPNQPTEREYKYVSSLSKCFLSIVTEYCSSIRRHKMNKVESTSCFINLLSSGEKMKEYGIMRNYWEGGFRGEGIFRPMKGLIRRGLHNDKISFHTLVKQYKTLGINDLIEMKEKEDTYISLLDGELSHDDDNNVLDGDGQNDEEEALLTDNPDRYRRFHCYESSEKVLEAIENNEVIAISRHDPTNVFYVIVGKRKRTKQLARLQITNWKTVRSTHVCDVNMIDDLNLIEDVSVRDNDYTSCIMLPLFHVSLENEERNIDAKYYIVDEHHGEMKSDGSFKMPIVQLSEKVDPRIEQVGNNDDQIVAANEICSDRNKCIEFVDKRVIPMEGLPYGKITHFRYVRGIQSVDTSVWTVKYYLDQDCTGHARKQEGIGYYELMNRLINP